MAARLSYLLWASAPDAELRRAAAEGLLDDPAGILSEVERMLRDGEKIRRVEERFILDWARLEALPDDDGLREDLIDSAAAFYAEHVSRGEPLFALLTSETAYLTGALAERYGATPGGAEVAPYDTAGLPNRGGLLTQPGVLAGMTNADGGEIVVRGLFLQHQLFCTEAPSPPAALAGEIDAFAAAQPPDASSRQIAEARLMRGECAVCHSHFDPLAYGFEVFDYRGGYRQADEFGNTLSPDGWIPASLSPSGEDQPYRDLDSYVARLAANEAVQRCLVQRHLEYALASRLHSEHLPSIAAITEDLGDGSVTDLIRRLVVHDLFRLMPVEETP